MTEIDGKYDIVLTTPDDQQAVVGFLKEFFFRCEPLVVGLKLREDVESMEKLENYEMSALDTAVIFKAVSANGDLMGVIVNEIMTRDGAAQEDGQEDDDDQEDSVNFKKFKVLFKKVKRECDVFGMYPDVDRLMHIKMVGVAEAYQGRGVCTALFEKTKELALENQCSLIHVACSSHFSAAAAKRLGYQCVYSLSYRKFKNADGQAMFDPLPPHGQFQVLVLPI